MRNAALSVLVVLFAGACRPVSYVIPDEVSCSRCAIEVADELEIGTEDGPGSLLGRPTYIAVDGLNRIWVSMLDYGFPYVYSPDGHFLEQVGRPGDGPGEFRMASVAAALPGDSVLLQAFPSYLVIGPELAVDRAIRGSNSMASLSGLRIVSWPEHVLASKITYAAGEMTSEVLPVDFSGEMVSESEPLVTVTGRGASIQRRAEPMPPAGIWVSEVTRYRLRFYGAGGVALDSLERRPDWFAPASEAIGFGGPNQAPTTMVSAVRSDSLGRLWVFVDRPRPDWGAAWHGFAMPQGRGEVRVSSLPPSYELWRTTVEVIDPQRHRVIARKELDGHAFAVVGPDRFATFRELKSGIPVVTIHRLRLIER